MFDFLFQNKKGELKSYSEIITINIEKIALYEMAKEKAINMIAHAIAKSEFIVNGKNGREKEHAYWVLNVRPNPNETATDFWIEVIKKLLSEGESLICCIKENLYRVDTYTSDDKVMIPRTYSNITIISNDERVKIEKIFNADDIIHLKSGNEKIKTYMEKVLSLYNEVASAMCAAKKIASTPKFSMDIDGQMPLIRKKGEDGKEKTLTIDEYKSQIKKMIESEEVEILTNSAGLKISAFGIESNVSSEDITKMANEIMLECAMAFDIPKAVFLGEITEKADSTNEFITFAVGWIVELLNDSMNAKLVGEEEYLKGRYIWIDMSRYKHVDIIESANNLDKLRSIGYNYDEVRRLTGWDELNTEFSQERVITKNYTNDLGNKINQK